MMKKISTHKICVFLPMMVLVLLFLWVKPVSAYAADYTKIDPTRNAKLTGYVSYVDGYTPYTEGRVHGGRGNLGWSDDLWLSGICLNLDDGGYGGGIEYSLHTHNYAWTRTAKGGEYLCGPIENSDKAYGSHAWAEAVTCQLYNGISNYYYIDYYAKSTRCTYNYLDMWSEHKDMLWEQWNSGENQQNKKQEPGKTMSEDTADMTNWNGQNWVGTTGMGMPLTGFTCELRRRTGTLEVNPNGGTWDGKTDSSKITYDTDSSFTINNPTREGYEFTGWTLTYTSAGGADDSNNYQAPASNDYPHVGATIYTASQGSGVSVGKDLNSSKILYVGNMRNIALTANWKALEFMQYINYYTYNASGDYTNPSFAWKQYGSPRGWDIVYGSYFNAYSHRLDCGNIAGYHWWSINSNGWAVGTGSGSTNSHFYPNTYRLSADLNGGSGTITAKATGDSINMLYGTYADLAAPTKAGYMFDGWKIIYNNSNYSYLSGNRFTMGYSESYQYSDYTSADTVRLQAKWKLNNYNIAYDLNDDTGSTSAQFGAYHPERVSYNTEFEVSSPTREGYSFAGWNITGMDSSAHSYGAYKTTQTSIQSTKETKFRNLNSMADAVVTFKALWIPNTYTIHFDGNGADSGHVDDMTVMYDTSIVLPLNAYALEKNTFVGWTHDADAHVGTYDEGLEAVSSEIIDAAGVRDQNKAEITLYCAWDPAPNITAGNKSFTLEEAKAGLITDERMFEDTSAYDEILDEEILPGEHNLGNGKTNSFTMTNYSPDEFPQFNDSGSSTITYRVVDSAGNITEKTITVYIVNNEAREPLSGEGTYRVRFISEEYYDKPEEEGGLMEDSIWRTDPEYAALLRKR